MGWFSDITGGIFEPISQEVAGIENAVKENPKTTAILAAATGAYFAPEISSYFAASPAAPATAEAGTAALSPVVSADVGSWGTVANVQAGTAASTASSAWTAKDVLTTANTGLSLASTGAKLSLLGKSMDAQSATANGLTGALAASPIQTPSGLMTTTPQGPLVAGAVAQPSGFMGMDNQTLFVIAVGIAAVYYFSKHGK